MINKAVPAEAALRAAVVAMLPDDGTPVLNRVMRVMLARRLERDVDDATFFAARDDLLAQGVVGRLRGQGGQIFLAKPEPARVAVPRDAEPTDTWPEASLMAPLRAYLEGPFRAALDLPADGACVVEDTSVKGPYRGKWARPDFVLVSAMRFKLMPGAQVDLHSFELKTEAGGGVLAIHEALAQTRWTHFGHVVWHLPGGSKAEMMLDDIVNHAEEHGVGLIRMRQPERAATGGCEVLVDPRRKPTLGAVADGFLESRLSSGQKATLLKAIGGQA